MASMQEIIARAKLNDQQRKSMTAQALIKAAGGDEISEIETIEEKADTAKHFISGLEDRTNRVFKQIKQMQTTLDAQTDVINDKPTRNGLAAYRTMLEATRDVFGESQMTEAVICKAIEAASYGMWRSVMGPK